MPNFMKIQRTEPLLFAADTFENCMPSLNYGLLKPLQYTAYLPEVWKPDIPIQQRLTGEMPTKIRGAFKILYPKRKRLRYK